MEEDVTISRRVVRFAFAKVGVDVRCARYYHMVNVVDWLLEAPLEATPNLERNVNG